MAKKIKRKEGECVYCGKIGFVEPDHVPPKNLFLSPRPSNLITVPSCRKCNHSFEKDDEYFKNSVIVRSDVSIHKDIPELNRSVLRGFERKESQNFKKYMFSQFSVSHVFTPSNLYLGKKGFLNIEHLRILKTTKRILKGLFFHHNKYRIPDDYTAVAYNLEFIRQPIEILDDLLTVPPIVIGNNVFSYRTNKSEDDGNSTVWFMTFFGASPFFGATFNKNIMSPEALEFYDPL